jgi:predicted O-linked N-acetylglucosamine transferase (SPINDLY family)
VKQRKPTVAEMFSAAFAVHQRGQVAEAAARYEDILRHQPDHADALHLRGLIAMEQGELELARHCVGQALARQPNHPQLLNTLGETLRRMGDIATAEEHLRHALRQAPTYVDALNNLGVLLSKSGRSPEGVGLFETILRNRPDDRRAMYNLGEAHRVSGDVAGAIQCYRQLHETHPSWIEAGSALLLTLCYDHTLQPGELLFTHRRVAPALHPAPAVMSPAPLRVPLPGYKLRIGFISGDFRGHAMCFFIEPLVRGLREMGVDAVAYYNFDRDDAITARLKPLFAAFIHVEQMSDDELDARIRADRIDVLVDLSGHTGHNRLGVFTRRPAPVQLNWIGYLATTGLDCFDAHLTDAVAVPPEMSCEFSEPLCYLPGCQWCYAPPAERPPADQRQSDSFVFGGLHNPAKINREVLLAWARILRATAPSRLLLMGDGVDALPARLAQLAPDGEELARRIDCRKAGSLDEFLDAHREIDLMLDSFPYSGGTTTFHALWMGVPVLTLAFDHSAGRGGASILARIGADDLVCTTQDDYVERAVAIAQGSCAAPLRGGALRQRLMDSSLVDAKGFTEGFMDTVRALVAAKADPS